MQCITKCSEKTTYTYRIRAVCNNWAATPGAPNHFGILMHPITLRSSPDLDIGPLWNPLHNKSHNSSSGNSRRIYKGSWIHLSKSPIRIWVFSYQGWQAGRLLWWHRSTEWQHPDPFLPHGIPKTPHTPLLSCFIQASVFCQVPLIWISNYPAANAAIHASQLYPLATCTQLCILSWSIFSRNSGNTRTTSLIYLYQLIWFWWKLPFTIFFYSN